MRVRGLGVEGSGHSKGSCMGVERGMKNGSDNVHTCQYGVYTGLQRVQFGFNGYLGVKMDICGLYETVCKVWGFQELGASF